MKIQRIDHIVIPVEDLERSIHFYTHVLGMELEVQNHHHAMRFGSQKINLHRGKAEFLPAAQRSLAFHDALLDQDSFLFQLCFGQGNLIELSSYGG